MSEGIVEALEAIEKQKGISKEIIIEAIETALISAYKKNFGQTQNVEVVFNSNSGEFEIYQTKDVVEEVTDKSLEISLEEAREKNPAYEVGDKIRFTIKPKTFGRIAAQTAKQVITQRVREEERNIIYNEYIQYEDDLLQGVIERMDNRFVYVNLGRIEAVLSKRDQIPNEVYRPHDRIKVYVSNVENTTKGPQVFVSRTHPNLIKRLFEQEVPEVYDGDVEIVSIAREAGDRSKLAVKSDDENIDPVGTCVGPRGQRVQAVVNELNGENMDIVEWDSDPATFITNALKPAEVVDVHFLGDENSVLVVVPDHQLSLAIGKRGQNVRLAARLTGFKIDIKSESDMEDYIFEVQNEEQDIEEVADIEAAEIIGEEEKSLDQDVRVEEDLDEVYDEVREIEADEEMADVTDIEYEQGELSPEQAEDMADLGFERQQAETDEISEEAAEERLDELETEPLDTLDEDSDNVNE